MLRLRIVLDFVVDEASPRAKDELRGYPKAIELYQRLLDHQGRPDTFYLHHHGPDLARAAALVANHLRVLLGDLKPSEGYAANRSGCGRGMRLVGATVEPTESEEGAEIA